MVSWRYYTVSTNLFMSGSYGREHTLKNVINLILRYIYMHIPSELLQEAFQPPVVNRSLDVLIKEKIIIDYVLAQCNIYAGRTKKIRLISDWLMEIDSSSSTPLFPGNYSVYKIPPEARENRALNAVLDLAFPADLRLMHAMSDMGMLSGRSVASSTSELLSSFTRTPSNHTPTPILVDGHTGIVRIEPPISMRTDWVLSCMLEYDKNFSNISHNQIPQLQRMALFATQAYIHNILIVKLNSAMIQSGASLDSVGNIVSSYADADDKFQESLMKWRGSAFFSKENLQDVLSMMF